MRRRSVFCLALAAVVPLAVGSAAVPASAATNSLTVTTISRAGTKVSSPVTLLGLSGSAIGVTYTAKSGKARTLPKAKYAVLVNIGDGGATATLGGKVVTVSGKTSATFDARNGKAVKATLDSGPAAGDDTMLEARVCAVNSLIDSVEVYGSPGSLFVLPNSAKTFQFAYLQSWQGAEGYVVSGVTNGIPKSPGGSFHRAGLAEVRYQVRSGLAASDDISLAVQPTPSQYGCQSDLYGSLHQETAPYGYVAHVTPGRWDQRADYTGGSWDAPATFVTGHSYSTLFQRAAWGPSHFLPQVYRKTLTYIPDELIGDPFRTGGDTAQMGTYTLSKGGTVLKKQTFSQYGSFKEFTRKLTAAGWYTLSVDAHRYYPSLTFPAGILSPRITLNWRFYAKPTVAQVAPVFLTRFVPAGLNSANQAAPGSTTSVAVTLDRTSQSPDVPIHKVTPKTVQVWASYDGGTSWHALAATKSGATWTVKVPDPASGAVALRSKVTDASGNSSTETVYRAYAIS